MGELISNFSYFFTLPCKCTHHFLFFPGVPLHRFPNPEIRTDIFNVWISNIGGELASLDNRTIYVNRRVCHKHFKDIHKYPKNRLCKLATPVLYLSGKEILEYNLYYVKT